MSIIVKSPRFKHRTIESIDSHHVQLLMQLLSLKSLTLQEKYQKLTNLQNYPQIAKHLDWLQDNDIQFKQLPEMRNVCYDYVLDKLLTSYQNLDVPLYLSEEQLEMFATKQFNNQELKKFIEMNYNSRETANNSIFLKTPSKVADFYYFSIINDNNAIFNYFSGRKWMKLDQKKDKREIKQKYPKYKEIDHKNKQTQLNPDQNIQTQLENQQHQSQSPKQSVQQNKIVQQEAINNSNEQPQEQGAKEDIQQRQIVLEIDIPNNNGITQTTNNLTSNTDVHMKQQIDISSISEIKPQFQLDKIPYFAVHVHESEFLKILKHTIQLYFNDMHIDKDVLQNLSQYTGMLTVEDLFLKSEMLLPEVTLYFTKNTITWKVLKNLLYKHVQNIECEYFFIPTIWQFYQIALHCKNDQEMDVSQFMIQKTHPPPEKTYKTWNTLVHQNLEEQRNRYINIQQNPSPVITKNKQIQCSIQTPKQKEISNQYVQVVQSSPKGNIIQTKQDDYQTKKQDIQQQQQQYPIAINVPDTKENVKTQQSLPPVEEKSQTEAPKETTQQPLQASQNTISIALSTQVSNSSEVKLPKVKKYPQNDKNPETVWDKESQKDKQQIKQSEQTEKPENNKLQTEEVPEVQKTPTEASEQKSLLQDPIKIQIETKPPEEQKPSQTPTEKLPDVIQTRGSTISASERPSSLSSNTSHLFKLDVAHDDGPRPSDQKIELFSATGPSKYIQNASNSNSSASEAINLNISVNTILEDEATDPQHTSSRSTLHSKKDSVLSIDVLGRECAYKDVEKSENSINNTKLQTQTQNHTMQQCSVDNTLLKKDEVQNQIPGPEVLLEPKNENQISVSESAVVETKPEKQEVVTQDSRPPIQKRKKVKSIMGTKMARVSKQDASAELQDQLDIIF